MVVNIEMHINEISVAPVNLLVIVNFFRITPITSPNIAQTNGVKYLVKSKMKDPIIVCQPPENTESTDLYTSL